MAEVVHDTGGGVTYQNDEQLLEAMTRLQNDSALRNALGSRGHDVYIDKYSEECHVKEYLNLLAEAAAARQQSTPVSVG